MFAKVFVLALVVALTNAKAEIEFDNEWEGELDFECDRPEMIHGIYSVHSNKVDDRKFRFDCTQAPSGATPGKCQWTDDFVNRYDETVMYACPANMILAGVKSFFRKKSEDRIMRFKCCKDSGVLTTGCTITDYINDWDEELRYQVPDGKVVIGWFSVHSDKKGDRRHRMLECRYRTP
ncbi:hemagglutinin/amebocyte aggregation factor [Elysia marginata]|uniref:Hemagglutinin/amebocyte aggregation factor n=1 Tax=Elysia marginata TaxID=1093978 RepID=A0AAV4JD26_9GAST|nr:hemagglutinin/amebocyte aggregation factor [Elysia marginata]